jgi:hypothetical protein
MRITCQYMFLKRLSHRYCSFYTIPSTNKMPTPATKTQSRIPLCERVTQKTASHAEFVGRDVPFNSVG